MYILYIYIYTPTILYWQALIIKQLPIANKIPGQMIQL